MLRMSLRRHQSFDTAKTTQQGSRLLALRAALGLLVAIFIIYPSFVHIYTSLPPFPGAVRVSADLSYTERRSYPIWNIAATKKLSKLNEMKICYYHA